MMRRFVLLAVMLVALVGCGPPRLEKMQETGGGTVYPVKVKVGERIIDCVIFRGLEKGGISCDW